MSSPYKLATDSPSRQLLWELNQLAISTQEGFYAHLDRENDDREALHRTALAAAAAEHERVRKTAEFERERLELQVQHERKRLEEDEQKDIERRRKEKTEQELAVRRREIELAKIDDQRAAEVKRLDEEAAETRKASKERQDAEIAKRLKEEQVKADQVRERAKETDTRAREVAVTAQKARAAPVPITKAPVPFTEQSASLPSIALNPAWEEEHRRYLEIHQRLKKLRIFMTDGAKQNPVLKKAMGDMRRDIKKYVGQVRESKEKGTNTQPLQAIITTLKKAVTLTEPTVDITTLLAFPPHQVDDPTGPALLVYLLNIFSKAIVAQFINEAGVKPLIADPVGTVASHIFAISAFRWKGISLVDILISKMHIVCPVLFGIYGPDQSDRGKQRLGWGQEEKGGPFVPEQRHFERMTGLGAGYAGISLKNYEKAQAENPYPDHHYWQALARMTNIPPQEITQTHFVVLKGMIEHYEAKFLQFYGDAAVAALRHVLVELPRRSPPSIAAKSLSGLVDVLRRDKKLSL